MDDDDRLHERLRRWLRPTFGEVVGVTVLLIGAVTATWLWWAEATQRPEPPPPTGAVVDADGVPDGPAPGVGPAPDGGPDGGHHGADGPTADARVTVQITGAVRDPGIVTLEGGRRVADAVEALGGLTPDAVTESVNLARTLRDGEHVHVPREGEPRPPTAGAVESGDGEVGPVDLNLATADELTSLPGIGPSLAAAIVEHRERDGPFGVPGDVRDVPGIGEATFQRLAPLVTTG